MTRVDAGATVSVIVPAFNAAATIARCVEAARALTPPPLEVLVVDDGSTDATAAIAERAGARVIRLGLNRGPGMARNAGAEAAAGEFLAFTDADCVVRPDWAATHLSLAADGRHAASTGPYSGSATDALWPQLMDVCLRAGQRGMPESIDSAISSNLVVRRADFLSVGGFPEYGLPGAARACFGNEDEDLAYLLSTRLGKPVRWVADGGPLHAYRPGLGGYLRQQAKYAESILVSYARFPAMAAGRSNYSKGGGALRVVSVWLSLLALAAFWHPAAVLWLAPFVLVHLPLLVYLVRAETHVSRRLQLALAGYPFFFLTGLAWSAGLLTGSVKAVVGYFCWHVFKSHPVART